MKIYRPHPFRPENKSVIHREWTEKRFANCPIVGSNVPPMPYIGRFVEYTFINKKGKRVHVPEYCLHVNWIDD